MPTTLVATFPPKVAPRDPAAERHDPRLFVATFDSAFDAAIAARLMAQGVATDGRSPRAAIASGEPSRAALVATDIVNAGDQREILLTSQAARELEERLPDRVALQPLADGGARPGDIFRLVSADQLVPHALPLVTTSFLGRETQLDELKTLLASSHLVTLSGPPGSGKTRLAVELAERVLGRFPDGAWFVPLAPIHDPGLIAPSVASVLGVKEDAALDMAAVIRRRLAGRRLLLVLDNFEQLVAGAPSLADWIRGAPGLCLLVTSRAVLRTEGEREYQVPPLPVPASVDDPRALETDAVRLFLARAGHDGASGSTDQSKLPQIAALVRRLDGLPLAIELAAARARVQPLAAIIAQVGHSLAVVGRDATHLPSRQRSLRAAIAWSYELLAADEQRFVRRVAVFKGGWELAAAAAVTLVRSETRARRLTASLLDKSLLQVEAGQDEPVRYEMLETIREYGLEQLAGAGELEATRSRHADWCLAFAEQAAPRLTGREQREWLHRLESNHDNLRAALGWTIEIEDPRMGLRLATALWRFWQMRGHIREGREWLRTLLAKSDGVDPMLRAAGLSAAGGLAYWQVDMEAACDLYQRSLELRRATGDPLSEAEGLYDLGFALTVPGTPTTDIARGHQLGREALELFVASGDRAGEAKATWFLAWNTHAAGNSEQAVPALQRSVELFRALGDQFGVAWALHVLGMSALRVERIGLAAASWREALQIFADGDDTTGIESVLDDLAALAVRRGQPERGLQLAAASARLREASGSRLSEMVRELEHRSMTGGRRLSEEAIDAAWRQGEAMSLAEAVALALRPDEEAEAGNAAHGLRVYALGSMRVERDGVPVQRWGGAKAGSRQGQAIFAFLFDRGDRGIAKDEVTELIWPDLAIRRGDLAFHRTLAALRTVLEQGPGEHYDSVAYSRGRYRLNPGIIGWSDVGAFEERLRTAAQLDGDEALAALEDARRLYRGELFDDCPFYGASSAVEERRTYLRGRLIDTLVTLGERYERSGDLVMAADRFRRALAVDPGSAGAAAGLERLGVSLAKATSGGGGGRSI